MANKAWHYLYNTARWRALRTAHLLRQPLCVMCREAGKTTAGQVVDHRTPHKGDAELFFNPENLQTLCKTHHDATKQREEKRGVRIGCDPNGYPLDPAHHWRQ